MRCDLNGKAIQRFPCNREGLIGSTPFKPNTALQAVVNINSLLAFLSRGGKGRDAHYHETMINVEQVHERTKKITE